MRIGLSYPVSIDRALRNGFFLREGKEHRVDRHLLESHAAESTDARLVDRSHGLFIELRHGGAVFVRTEITHIFFADLTFVLNAQSGK